MIDRVDRIADIWGTRTPFARGDGGTAPWPGRLRVRMKQAAPQGLTAAS
ncbi:hypothetical protein LVY72_02325 [Arthrobacter sp. I2-34]|uniref:Uncharacterized protein n=1 Tax=Arthrobacter hankyongi TaxID=2904801 RepID=A0ABS9L2K0_9MICC|nr:hypothetical protein [Arthrobacter hankyongi]MCG2620744.1 hypothetical protein [Arthrobacter hankyongi]